MAELVRHKFLIATDASGDYTDTGPPIFGAILQIRYVPTVGDQALDTGADIDITLPTTGVVVANWDNIGGSAFTKVPKQPVHDTGGQDEGSSEFIFAAGEPLRVVVSTGNTGDTGTSSHTGTLHVWTG